jgi:uncharacterized membrane protein
VSSSSRYLAFFSYLLSLPGALYVLAARNDDAFAVFHARQSRLQALIGIITPIVWVILGWVLAWIPLVGPMLSVCLFALVIAIYIVLIVDWVIGMTYALGGRMRRTPIIGPLALRAPPAAPAVADPLAETSPEVIERTTVQDV